MPSIDLSNPLEAFHLLARVGVPFVVIGGHAVAFHGYVRTTEDADLVFERTPEAEAALLGALESIHACWIGDEIDKETGIERTVPVTASYIRSCRLMMLTTDLGFLDIFDYVPGFPDTPVRDIFVDAVPFEGVKFISLSWLRKLKTAANRHKDLDDLEHLPPSS